MKKVCLIALLLVPLSLFAERPCFPEKSLKKIMEGNQRFMSDELMNPDRSSDRRKSLTSKQEPFACVLACSDSRVAPEVIFDQGIGSLFSVRVAGNAMGPLEKESLDYAVHYLDVCLIIVLGHEKCAAVETVLAGKTEDIEDLAKIIDPAIKSVKEGSGGNKLERAIKRNAIDTANRIKEDPDFAGLIKENKLQVYPAYYHFESGKVELLTQDAL